MKGLRTTLAGCVVLGLLCSLLVIAQVALGEEATETATSVEPTLQLSPDLVITSIKTPQGITTGKNVPIEITVATLGDEHISLAVSSVTISVQFGQAEVVLEVPVPTVGEELIQEVRFTFPSSRWFDIVAMVDPQNEIVESNEDNNQLATKVHVSKPDKSSSSQDQKPKECPCRK